MDRLRLTPPRIADMAKALEEVAALPEPIGQIISSSVRPNGLEVQKVRVPLGVIFFIYESRPNVTADAAALCVKAGNAVILRGGKEAAHSNAAIGKILAEAAAEAGLPADAVQLVATTDRAAVGHLLRMPEYIDLCIPRGGASLIRRVSEEARMPVIKHFAGNCHVYLDESADADMAEKIVVNAKCQRMGVCNAAESLVVHRAAAERLLPRIGRALVGSRHRNPRRPAHAETAAGRQAGHRGRLFRRVSRSDHLPARWSARWTRRSSTSTATARNIPRRSSPASSMPPGSSPRRIDSSAVMIKASTRFNDGGEFGLGAEIGISTDKFHARGPCGIDELTSYKYVVYGNGQVRG